MTQLGMASGSHLWQASSLPMSSHTTSDPVQRLYLCSCAHPVWWSESASSMVGVWRVKGSMIDVPLEFWCTKCCLVYLVPSLWKCSTMLGNSQSEWSLFLPICTSTSKPVLHPCRKRHECALLDIQGFTSHHLSWQITSNTEHSSSEVWL